MDGSIQWCDVGVDVRMHLMHAYPFGTSVRKTAKNVCSIAWAGQVADTEDRQPGPRVVDFYM